MKDICPSLEGGVSPSSPPAYSPRTHLFYTSTNNLCMDYARRACGAPEGHAITWGSTALPAGPGRLSRHRSWHGMRSRASKVWENKEPFPNWSGALVTGGDVAFYGTLDGWFKSVDATHRQGAVEIQGRVRASSETRSPSAAPTASNTSRCMPGSVVTGRCFPGMSAPMIRPTCGRRRTSRKTSHGTRARAGSSGSSACEDTHAAGIAPPCWLALPCWRPRCSCLHAEAGSTTASAARRSPLRLLRSSTRHMLPPGESRRPGRSYITRTRVTPRWRRTVRCCSPR